MNLLDRIDITLSALEKNPDPIIRSTLEFMIQFRQVAFDEQERILQAVKKSRLSEGDKELVISIVLGR